MIIFVQFWGVYYLKPLFVTILLALLVQKGFSENAFSLKFQDWKEDNDRIHVRSCTPVPKLRSVQIGNLEWLAWSTQFPGLHLGADHPRSRKLALSPRGGKTSRYN